MSFLNPWMLLGTLGIGLPILAHILNRFQVRHTEWAAMRFLNRKIRVRSRQIRLRDLLLLALRCLALLLLIFALARPAWKDGTADWLPGESRAGVIIALDTSFSMEHRDGEESRFERALEHAKTIASKIKRGDPVSLILLDQSHRVAARNVAFDPEKFDRLLDELQPSPSSLVLDEVPEQIAPLLDEMEAAQKEIYLITDTQASDWRERSDRFLESLAALTEEARLFMIPVRGTSSNLAVTELNLVSGVLRKGTTARYQATVHNFGTEPASNVEVNCQVEGVQIDRKTIPLIAPGASETVSLFVPFYNAGATRITAALGNDQLPIDNTRRAVAMVRDKVSVLCVDGSNGDAGRLVTAALQARGQTGGSEDYLVRSIPWLSLPSENLAEVDVLVLADVPEVTPTQVEQLSRHVREGNGLIWFAGPEVKTDRWNKEAATGPNPLLPARLGLPVKTNNALGAGRPLEPNLPDHSVCLPLQSLPEDLFSETRFLTRLEVQPHPSSFPVLALAGDGGPILLEQSHGRGHVFLFTTSATSDWNNMALTPVFPMLLQQMVTYLSGREFEQPSLVGDSLSLSYTRQPDASDAVFESPSGKTIPVAVRQYQNEFMALLEKSDEAGFYLAKVSVQSPGTPVAVNVHPRESDVATLTPEELAKTLEETGITLIEPEADLASAIESTRSSRSSWRPFMIAGLVFLLLECLLADRLQRRRSGRHQTKDSPDALADPQDA